MKKLEKIVHESKSMHERWQELLESYMHRNYYPNQYSEDEGIQVFYDTNELLADIAKTFYKYGNFKDTWDDSKCYINVFGQNLLLKSIKTNHTFDWGADRTSFYLHSYISYPENLKNMGDDFWELILSLSKYGEFKFAENAGISSKEQQYFNNKKSNLFRLFRNYMLNEINNLELEEYERKYDMDLGWFELKWEFGTPWDKLVEDGCMAFKSLYQLNYQLWKIHDLREKKYARQQML